MKMTKLKLILILAFAGLCASTASAQATFGPEWGENATSEQRYQNALTFNYYKDAYDNKNYDQALVYLKELLANCPKAKVNIYVWGTNIYKQKIARATSAGERTAYADSLMMLYDKRLENFADHAKYGAGYILKAKAKDYANFKSSDVEGLLACFDAAIKANENDIDPTFINQYFNVLTEAYKNLDVETDDYMERYEYLSALMAQANNEEAQNAFDALFSNSGAADCENLEKIYKARYEANPDDLDLVIKIFNQMNRVECSSEFFATVGEKYMSLQPSSSIAMALARAYEAMGDMDRSLTSLKAAVASEEDAMTRAQLCVQIAGNLLSTNDARDAASYAKQALEINPESGFAYIYLATAYAQGASACSDFDRQSVYWLAYDVLQNARRLLADDAAQLEKVNMLMSSYRASFPSKEECFFRGLTAGASYTVQCGWVSGRTTVKE